MTRASFLRMIALGAALAGLVAFGPTLSAQEGPEAPTSTTVDDTGDPTPTSSTTVPSPDGPGPTTTVAPPTTVYVPPVPPELVDDPRVPFLVDPGEEGVDIPIAQLPFDPLSVSVLPERVEAARTAVAAAELVLLSVQQQFTQRTAELAELAERVRTLDADARTAVEAAAAARKALADHAVTAYMVGPAEEQLALLRGADFVDMGVARSYLDVVAGTRARLLREYRERSDGLSDEHARMARELGERSSELQSTQQEFVGAFTTVISAREELAAYEAGAHAYIEGFVFPVAGPVEFIDSWGYPRMMGTSSAHWHQGTDIFAAAGTPLVASENGVLARIGTASLGGNKLWVKGDSGNEYYYAHLSAFAEGIEDGQRVRAGQVVGYVGDTGNAKGTSPHLHFEIHPNGIGPANPYPLLKAAYGARPTIRAVAPTTTAPPAPGSDTDPGR